MRDGVMLMDCVGQEFGYNGARLYCLCSTMSGDSFGGTWRALGTSLMAQMVKNLFECGRPGFNPWVGKIPSKMEWLPTPILSPGKSRWQASLVGYSPWSHRVGHNLATEQWRQQRQDRRAWKAKSCQKWFPFLDIDTQPLIY